jgi:hypothetical protein
MTRTNPEAFRVKTSGLAAAVVVVIFFLLKRFGKGWV